ncbi:hypothetical protein [Shewanella acanthi]|uniref:hypothetical protein n=1 Tax=Shewanella acanthi TaxID=2864212 RepID=UPI001C65CCEC|nr:hypothetical protein [Shewanella acanthi]QYJ79433.1 hypothetical protein K0H61_03010 [Shewanella acanthi]
MGLPVTVYRHTDAGAPQLVSCTPSEWINILKKVLVEGYGTKAPLGWTLEFEDTGTYQVAFRNSTTGGSGGFVKFQSASGANSGNMRITAAASMTDINTFVRSQYYRTFALGTAAKGWEIIGTARGFWFIQHYTTSLSYYVNSNLQTSFFIGDIEALYDNDAGRFMLITGYPTASDSTGVNSGYSFGSRETIYGQSYATDGSNTSAYYSSETFTYLYPNTGNSNAETLGVKHVVAPVVLTISSNFDSLTLPRLKGFVPGAMASSFAGYGSEVWPKELTFNGKNHVGVRGTYGLCCWINTEEWYV